MGRVKKLFEALREYDEKSFAALVKDSYDACCQKVANQGYEYPVPTPEEVAEDLVDNYEQFKDVDLSSPEKYASWVSNVRAEIIRQDLPYADEKIFEKIKKNGDKWEIWSKDGSKKLGTFDTEEEAKKRLKAIEFFKHKNESEDPIDIEALEFYVNNWHEGDNITVTADLLNVLEKALKMAKQYSLKESNSIIDDYLKKFKKDNNDRYYVLDDEIDQVNREIADFGYSLQKASHGPGPGEWYFLKPIEDSERPVDED